MSLRYRLPLTYGLIALLAALALGAALLLILRNYYGRQEQAYLERNATVIRDLLAGTAIDNGLLVERQMRSLAFLTQTRIRVFDSADNLIADTGLQENLDARLTMSFAVEGDGVSHEFNQVIEGEPPQRFANSEVDITVAVEGSKMRVNASVSGNSAESNTIATPWNFTFNPDSGTRSSHVVRASFPNVVRAHGGYVELSDGPAFGGAMMRSVTWGLVVAASLAVSVATVAGILMARRITLPLLTLTKATEQLQAGDLSARSGVERGDEIGRLSATFNTMASRVEHTVATLRHFVADAAHEINTPLTALKTNLELVEQQPNNPHHLQEAQQQTERLIDLTRDLLQLSRLESDEMPLVRVPLDMGQLLAVCSEPFASQAEQRDMLFTLRLPSELVCVDGDVGQLRRVFDNLLDNALKFTEAGGEIDVGLVVKGNSAEITIRDSGIGIDGDPNRIFDRFHRAPNAAAYEGSGLGLAIVQHIVRAHNGQIVVKNNEKTEFNVKLPISLDIV